MTDSNPPRRRIPGGWLPVSRFSARYWRPVSLLVAIVGLLLVFGWVGATFAQEVEAWPDYPLADDHRMERGPGGYLSPVKLVICMILFWLWVRTADWVNRDCGFADMPLDVWNMVIVFPFFVAMLLTLSLPVFAIGFVLLILSFVTPLLIYVLRRNEKVAPNEKVFTPEHILQILSGKRRRSKKADEPNVPRDKGPPVGLLAMGAKNELNDKSNLAAAQQLPGFIIARELMYEALSRQAERVMLDYTKNGVSVRNQIDGVWHDAEPYDQENGDELLVVLKKLADLDVNERRKRQSGRIGVQFSGRASECSFLSQGIKTGERVVVELKHFKPTFKTFDELGMRPKMQEQLAQHLRAKQGVVLICALPGGGLSTTLNVVLQSTDRFLRHVVSFQDVEKREPDVDNIEMTTFSSATEDTPHMILERLIRTEPDIIAVPNLSDPEIASMLCAQAVRGRLVVATMRAKEASECLLRVLNLKVPAPTFAPAVTVVLNQRHIRRLCVSCREAFAPTAELLRKLKLPPERVEVLYREGPPPADERDVCKSCGGIGYRGRIAIFEQLEIGDELREALISDPKQDVLRSVARKNGNRSLQEEGIVLVARGITSLEELQRVLKQ